MKFAQEIVDTMLENGATDGVASAAAGWGFDGLAADATAKDFFMAIAHSVRLELLRYGSRDCRFRPV